MEIKNLTYILEAYKCHSVNKAAKNVFISQPHLSSIIKNVEAEIGYSIFNRTPTGLTATQEGRLFLENAEKIVNGWDSILNVPKYLDNAGSLSICSTPSSFTFQAFLDYQRNYPSARCYPEDRSDAFLESGLKETMKQIVAQQCRLGILMMVQNQIKKYSHLADDYKLDFFVLKDGIAMNVYMSRSHPLSQAEVITTSDLSQYPAVSDINLDIDDRITFANNASHILYVSDRGTSYDAIRKGGYLLVGLIEQSSLKDMDCICKPVADGDKLAFCFIKPQLCELNFREHQFITYFCEKLEKL